MLVLFVVETNKENNSDYMYIKRYLGEHFEVDPVSDVLRPIYMNGKGNYNSK